MQANFIAEWPEERVNDINEDVVAAAKAWKAARLGTGPEWAISIAHIGGAAWDRKAVPIELLAFIGIAIGLSVSKSNVARC